MAGILGPREAERLNDERPDSGMGGDRVRRGHRVHGDVQHRPEHRARRAAVGLATPGHDGARPVLRPDRRSGACARRHSIARAAQAGGDRRRADVDLARRAGGAASIARRGRPPRVRPEPADLGGAPRGRLDAAVHRGAEPRVRRASERRALGRRPSGVRGPAAAAGARHGAAAGGGSARRATRAAARRGSETRCSSRPWSSC